ncbi:MAG: 1-deoxy-D-xylulose-5-phosphate reductoisomerase [Casimicrobiaceae bacterium]|nr:1-deoxy-D-xylulose-5-phosphate reductoisomerase [Casimicrobiaceae bacterium]MCX8098958.1 1-deoxy-D-xylulose-5-phosphate reductoisomerase [Casimicrobiaceae bacterium]
MKPQRLAILGATGSIGHHTLEVVRQHRDRFRVYAFAARRDWQGMLALAHEFQPEVVAFSDTDAALSFREALGRHTPAVQVEAGAASLCALVQAPAVDMVVAGISGFAGLASTWAAVEAGKRVLLANKEALVAAGRLLLARAAARGAQIVPLDSEHNALYQCLGGLDTARKGVARLTLTASGGPFRTRDLASFATITPEEAVRHPNWAMGRKISVDSATLINKGLEVIEAALLFDRSPDEIDVLIHPSSVVHALVEFVDGSVLAHLGPSNMSVPIAHALGASERLSLSVERLSLARLGRLEFFAVDPERYPALSLAYEALSSGQAACIALNASNELAVEAFLEGRLRFTDIVPVIEATLSHASAKEPKTLEDVYAIDQEARRLAYGFVEERARRVA